MYSPKCVLMAGGRGTRIASAFSEIPKPMIEIGGKPVIRHIIDDLKEQGIREFIITIGHLGSIIKDNLGDGSSFGVSITYYEEERLLGNAGALFEIRDQLDDDFLLINADILFKIDIQRFIAYHHEHHGLATIYTHPNSHPYDSALIVSDENGVVQRWLSKEDDRTGFYKNSVNAGIHMISPILLAERPDTEKVDLDRQLLKPLAGTDKLISYQGTEYVCDMGTPERYEKVSRNYEIGLVSSKCLIEKQKAIFLDRDGTINRNVGFLRNIDDFELLDGVSEAIKKINRSGYLAIVITNQPVIARGEVTFDELGQIHNKMETLLGADGAYLDDIFYCPHHPDSGFEGEIPELKIDCQCRKPKPGLILKAAEKYSIDLSKSWMIGDSKNDIECGKAAGCSTVLIGEEDYGEDMKVSSLLEFVNEVL